MAKSRDKDDKRSNDDLVKQANIAKIIGLMEETERTKDWLVDKIKERRILRKIDPTASRYKILKACPNTFVSELLRILEAGGFIEFSRISPATRTYHWFFTDIVAASKDEIATKDQTRKIIVLTSLIAMTTTFQNRDPECKILPTGDGVAIGFTDSPESPLSLAIELHKLLHHYNQSRKEKEKIRIRIGLDTGPVYLFNDLNQNENVWGPGIITARRVMDLGNSMHIIASDSYANSVRNLKEDYRKLFVELGYFDTKHKKILIYNVVGEGFGNKTLPVDHTQLGTTSEEQAGKIPLRFTYESIKVELQISNSRSWMTHHVLIWNFTNISKEPIGSLSYSIDGDKPRAFKDLHLKVTDAHGKKQELLALDLNKPDHKEFHFGLDKPILPGKQGFARIEYDWQEPKRYYYYSFASDCRNFKFALVMPKGIEVTQRVYRVNYHTKEKTYAAPAKVRYLAKMTEVTWSAANIPAHDAYEFHW